MMASRTTARFGAPAVVVSAPATDVDETK